MPDFSKRSQKQELLDDPGIPFPDIQLNMRELNVVNTWLGGHRITLKGFQKLLGNKKEVSVCEIGCGGGDNLLAIEKWCRKNNITVRLIGIDINPNCIEFAKQQTGSKNYQFICSDFKDVNFDGRPDIIFSSLFCHHFSNDEIVGVVRWMEENADLGFFINDLHRHPFAHYTIKWITKLFSKSYLVKHDAPLSVLRGFTKKEWKNIFQKAAIDSFKISWEWAFRHLIIASPQSVSGGKVRGT